MNALDLGDNTALHWAAMRGHVEIVNLLLQVRLLGAPLSPGRLLMHALKPVASHFNYKSRPEVNLYQPY